MSMRYPGGLIATSPVNARYPSGVWTQAQAAPYQAQNVWTRDQFWPNTTLLLQGDGAVNGAQNNTFLDSSSNNFTITRNGNTTQGTFTPYEATGYWSAFFAGGASGGYITSSTSADYAFGTGDFTIEGFVFITGTGTGIFQQGTSNFPTSTTNTVALGTNGGTPTWQMYARNAATNSTATWVANTWYHFAVVRSGTTTTLYINGSSVITVTSDNTNYTGTNFGIGSIYGTGSTERFTGYLSNLRVVKGAAVYTANFTPPTSPLTAFSSGTTALIALQSNRYIDTSASPKTLTVTGDTSVQAFQPFPGATTWSASVLGGSGYFDGSGDYLTVASATALNLGSGDFTIEVFWYPTAFSTDDALVMMGTSAGSFCFALYNNSTGGGVIALAGTGGGSWDILSGLTVGTAVLNQWNHVVLTRSGTTFSTYMNGVRGGTQTSSSALGSANLGIAANSTGGSGLSAGYLSDLRILKGTSLYSGATITVPTAPLTAITNTSLLCSFTNAGIYDNSMMNNLETVGNAQVSTSVVKYGTGSMAFDGNGDYLTIPPTQQLNFGSGNFTFEFWAYLNTTSGSQAVWHTSNFAGDTPGGVYIRVVSGAIEFAASTDDTFGTRVMVTSSTSLSATTWTHVACVRNGNTLTIYINGTSSGSATFSGSAFWSSTYYTRIGYWRDGDIQYLNAYLDDFRITKGAARYITNFTPPIARLPAQ